MTKYFPRLTRPSPCRIIDTHYKTAVMLGSFAITTSGWWAWNGFLSSAYAGGVSPYAVRHGFATTFGSDLAWWLTLIVVVGVLTTAELGYRAVKRSLVVGGVWGWGSWRKWLSWAAWKRVFRGGVASSVVWSGEGMQGSAEEWGVEMWQEMERDPGVRRMLRKMVRGDEDGNEDADEAEDIVAGDEENEKDRQGRCC